MAAHRPELYTAEAVLKYYEQQPATMYRVFAGMVPDKQFCRYQYLDEKNKDAGYEQLRLALDSIQADKRNTNPYVLQCIDSITQKGSGTKTVEKIDAINIGFKLNDDNYKAETINGVTLLNPATTPEQAGYMERLFIMMEKNNEAMLSRLEALENKIGAVNTENLEYVEEEEPTGKEMIMGALGNILQNPKVQEATGAILAGLAAKFMSTEKKEASNDW